MGKVGSRMAFSALHSSSVISSLGSTPGVFLGILMYHPISALLFLGQSITSGSLEVEYFQQSLEVSGE